MGAVRLPDTIRRRLEKEGRLPVQGPPVIAREDRGWRRDDDWAAVLAGQARMVGLPDPVREWRFHERRRWRFDLAWPDGLVAVEVDGGAFIGGRHTSGSGFREDCVKLSEAAAMGWRVIRAMPEHVQSGEALGWLQRALAVR